MTHSAIQNNFDLPQELCVKPLVLVGVSGLDTLNNAIHKAIWETFTGGRRVERSPVVFKLISNAHEFPVVKPKRNSYDWYIPRGILKKNWMNKHLYEIPAVTVIFYELDWNDPQWNEKMIECASRVQSMRAALEGRNTKITVVLIQNVLPLPPGEDILASERAVSLCASCELNSQSLFILPIGDHLQGYAIRLENAFYEFGQNYYHSEAKIIRSHKDHLNKNTHQYLYVRHQFKMAFLYELKQDPMIAHKHYSHAYNNLLEIRIVDTNALEIRMVAGYLNYKLCKLLFSLNLPRDAISHFKNHIERFKHRLGFQDLAFEHYAWLSKQFQMFGDTFDEAVKLGLPAVQIQHPGIYYQQAAQYAIVRKNISREICSKVTTYPQPDPLENFAHMEYYGQRPWRPGKLSQEAPEPQMESNGIQALQYLEKQINHSNIIIALYGLAISQFKTYRCPRTRKHLVLQMADEYYDSQDYSKALTLLSHMLWDFRQEKWWSLMSNIMEKALKCAFLTGNIQDYMSLSLELLGKSSSVSLNNKKRIYENFNRVLKKEIPFGDPDLPHDMLQKAIIIWQPIFTSPQLNIALDMASITNCIETKARFLRKTYEVDQKVAVEVYLRNTSPFIMTFSQVSVTINTPVFTSEYAVNNSSIGLEFTSSEVKKFLIEFYPDPNDILKDIQIGNINIQMGMPGCKLELKFNSSNDSNGVYPEFLHFKHTKEILDFDNIRPLSTATIVPRSSKLDINFAHKQPALLGEWYEVCVHIDNKESNPIENLEIVLSLIEEESPSTTEISNNSEGTPQTTPLNLEIKKQMNPGETTLTYFYLRVHKVSVKNIQIKLTYLLCNDNSPVISTKTESLLISVVQPFTLSTTYLSTLMLDINTFYVGEEFGIMPAISILSTWPLVIEETSFEFNPSVQSIETNIKSPLCGMKLNEGEIGTELFLASCDRATDQNVTLGQYNIKWRRSDGRLCTTSKVMIVGYQVLKVPLKLGVTLPAHGIVRTPTVVNYTLENTSNHLIQLDINVDASDGFMFAGLKQFMLSILPHSTQTLKYNLYPLLAGNIPLPKLNLNIPANGLETPLLRQDELNALVQRSLPTHLFIIPQAKGITKLPSCVNPQNITVK
ncbi:hypothetical protein HHI36_008247 [Cryptolaemus montrouzieri]|uniref:Trafficking protein particle complex subunit 11 n=1 Tax=Cryptolaemus montrouzieri TaxID=559131 RepID=A0ABD2MSP4_9CUCU